MVELGCGRCGERRNIGILEGSLGKRHMNRSMGWEKSAKISLSDIHSYQGASNTMVFLVLAVMYEPKSVGSHSRRLIELLSLLNVQNPTRTLLSYILQRLNLCGVGGGREEGTGKKCLHLGEVNRKISSIPEGGAGTLRITHAPDPGSKCMSNTDS